MERKAAASKHDISLHVHELQRLYGKQAGWSRATLKVTSKCEIALGGGVLTVCDCISDEERTEQPVSSLAHWQDCL